MAAHRPCGARTDALFHPDPPRVNSPRREKTAVCALRRKRPAGYRAARSAPRDTCGSGDPWGDACPCRGLIQHRGSDIAHADRGKEDLSNPSPGPRSRRLFRALGARSRRGRPKAWSVCLGSRLHPVAPGESRWESLPSRGFDCASAPFSSEGRSTLDNRGRSPCPRPRARRVASGPLRGTTARTDRQDRPA